MQTVDDLMQYADDFWITDVRYGWFRICRCEMLMPCELYIPNMDDLLIIDAKCGVIYELYMQNVDDLWIVYTKCRWFLNFRCEMRTCRVKMWMICELYIGNVDDLRMVDAKCGWFVNCTYEM